MSDVRTEKGDLVDGLRNCPFCGSEARWAATNIDGDWEIQCSNMGCPVIFIGRDETGRELAAAWNNRPELASWQARAEQAESTIAELTVEVKRLKEAALDATGKLITLSSSAYHLAEVAQALKRWEDAIWSGQMEPQPAPLSLMQSIDSALNALPLGSRSTDLEREGGK